MQGPFSIFGLDSFSITENVVLSSDLQITAPSGFSLGSVELSVGSEVAVNEGTVTQQISEARVAIPSQAELDDIDPQGGDLRVDLFVDNVQVLDTTFRVDQGRTPQEVAERLRDHIEGQLTGAPTGGPQSLRIFAVRCRTGFRLRSWAQQVRMISRLCCSCRRAWVTSGRTLILRVR